MTEEEFQDIREKIRLHRASILHRLEPTEYLELIKKRDAALALRGQIHFWKSVVVRRTRKLDNPLMDCDYTRQQLQEAIDKLNEWKKKFSDLK